VAFVVAIAIVLVALPTGAQSGKRGGQGRSSGPGTGNPAQHQVTWLFLQGDPLVHDTPLTVYWLPESAEHIERSPLMESQTLLDASTRCVGFQIVLPAQTAVIASLGLAGKLPAALMLDREGHVLRSVESVRGELRVKDVEAMVKAELQARDEQMYQRMSTAARLVKEGNNPAAIALYQKVWDDRCLFSVAGDEARRALKSLGVVVKEPPSSLAPDPNLKLTPQTEKPRKRGSGSRGREG
jgi:hypothetical protein